MCITKWLCLFVPEIKAPIELIALITIEETNFQQCSDIVVDPQKAQIPHGMIT